MKKNGFTLVELLAVIVLLGLLMAIAIPSALTMSSKVKAKAYNTKIDLIESAGKTYGQSNLSLVRRGINPSDNRSHSCYMTYDNDKIKTVQFNKRIVDSSKADSETLGKNEYWCLRVTIQDLVNANSLDYDESNLCSTNKTGCATDEIKSRYNNVVLNPTTDYIINTCYVYIYYKYNRVYSVFDRTNCSDSCSSGICENYGEGHEYRKLN